MPAESVVAGGENSEPEGEEHKPGRSVSDLNPSEIETVNKMATDLGIPPQNPNETQDED